MKNELKNLIEKDKTEKVIQILKSITTNTPSYNEVVIISNSFTLYARGKRMKTYSSSDEEYRSIARIHDSLLKIIDNLSDEQLNQNINEDLFEEPAILQESKRKYWNFSIFLFLLLIVVGIFFYSNGFFFSSSSSPIINDPNLSDKPQNSTNSKSTNSNGSTINPEINDSIKTNNEKEPLFVKEESDKKSIQKKTSNTNLLTPKVDEKALFKKGFISVSGKSMKSFRIAIHEVTIEQYLLFCKQTNYFFPQEVDTSNKQLPITNISWKDAKTYCKHVGGNLPTSIQWEFAASGGIKTKGYQYSGGNNEDSVAWYLEESVKQIMKKQANELGIFDMSGNAAEWCLDAPKNHPKSRIIKGGSFKNHPEFITIKSEDFEENTLFRDDDLGFRVVFNN